MEACGKLASLPAVKLASHKLAEGYDRVKSNHETVKHFLEKAESVAGEVKNKTSPVAKKLQGPLQAVDKTLCKGLDYLEEKLPVVKRDPREVYEAAKHRASKTVRPAVKKGRHVVKSCDHTLRDVAAFLLRQINMVAKLVEMLARGAESVVDHFFQVDSAEGKPVAAEEPQPGPSSAVEDTPKEVEKRDHQPQMVRTAGAVARLGFKVARAGVVVARKALPLPCRTTEESS